MARPRVKWFGVDDSTWVLAGDGMTSNGVMLTAVSGLVASPSRKITPSTNGVGVEFGRSTWPMLEGELKCRVYARKDETVQDTYSHFLASFSTFSPGRLSISMTGQAEWEAECLLKESIGAPEKSPAASGLISLDVEIPLICNAGAFSSPVERIFDSKAIVRNIGDLPLFPNVVWSGAGQTVRLPNGVLVTLPTVSGERVLSTDPGRGYVVTDRAGKPDKAAWASLRGLAVPGETLPGNATSWELSSGVHLEVVQRRENPWR